MADAACSPHRAEIPYKAYDQWAERYEADMLAVGRI